MALQVGNVMEEGGGTAGGVEAPSPSSQHPPQHAAEKQLGGARIHSVSAKTNKHRDYTKTEKSQARAPGTGQLLDVEAVQEATVGDVTVNKREL
jgi:hypothetical protein